MNRPSWDEYFMTICRLTAERSNCIKRKVGCIIVKDNRILSLGYNGTPSGLENCFSGGCKRCAQGQNPGENLDMCLCLHAEENAMLCISSSELTGATVYITLMPCIGCVKKIIQCKIARVVWCDQYNLELDKYSLHILELAKIKAERLIF